MKKLGLLLLLCLTVNHANANVGPLEGHWVQECQRRLQKSEEFRGHEVRYTETYFAGDHCQAPIFIFAATGPYSLFFHEIDFIFMSISATAVTPAMASDFNQRRVCGFQNWQPGQAREVAGLGCDFFRLGANIPTPARGQKKFGRWKVIEDKLFFGRMTRERDGSAPDRRSLEWDSRFYQRQSPFRR